MAKAPTKKPAKKAKTTAKKVAGKAAKTKTEAQTAASVKTAAKKTAAKKATTAAKKASSKSAAPKKKKQSKSAAKSRKRVTGYGSGGVDVVMSVDQVAKEAASIAANAPSHKELLKLAGHEPLLTINSLRAGYGKMEILHDFKLEVAKGQSLCLIGPNGAGKSTVLHSIFGFTLSLIHI